VVMIGERVAVPGSLALLAQQRAQPAPHEAVHDREGRAMRVLEVVEPAPQYRVQARDDLGEALASGATGFLSDALAQLLHALLAHPSLPRFEAVSQEVEALAHFPAVPDLGLVGMQLQPVDLDPSADFRQRRLRL